MNEALKLSPQLSAKAIGEKDYALVKTLSEEDQKTITNALPYIELGNNLHQAFWIGGKGHKTIYVNEIYRRISGYSLKESIGQPADFCFTKESKIAIAKHHELREKGLTTQYEAEIISKDGIVTPVLINGMPTKEGGSMGLFTNLALMDKLSRDEQKLLGIIGYKDFQLVKKKLKPEEITILFKYRHALKLANVINHCFWIGDSNHKTVYTNKLYQKLTEYSLEECLGKPADFCFTEESKRTIESHHKLRKIGVSSQYEAEYLTKSGKTIPVLIIGAPSETGGTYGMHIDLREIKKMDSQKRIFEQIIKNSIEAIVILDKNHKITMWNTGAEKMFGYKENEVLNQKIAALLVPKELQHENKKIVEEVEEKKILRNYETKRNTASGEKVDVSLSVTKVTDKNSKFIGYLVTYRDITQQKKVSSELQKRFETIQDAYKELGLQRRHLDYLYEIIDSAISKESNLENFSKLLVSALCMLTKCDGAILRLYSKSNNVLKLKACFGVSQKWLNKDQIKFENSLAQEAFKNGRPIIIDDVDLHPKYQGAKLLKVHKFKTMILIPLYVNDEILGSISLYATSADKFRLIETDFLEKIGKQCSLSLFVKKITSK